MDKPFIVDIDKYQHDQEEKMSELNSLIKKNKKLNKQLTEEIKENRKAFVWSMLIGFGVNAVIAAQLLTKLVWG